MSARDAVIVDAVRTPVGKRNGSLAKFHAVDLSAHVLTALAARNGFDPAVVDDVIWGCVQQVGQQGLNVARMAVLAAGWPESVPGTTVDRQCGSSQQSIHFAAAGLLSGQYDVAIAGGVRPCAAGLAGRDRRRPGPAQPGRRRHRHRPPARRVRRPPDDRARPPHDGPRYSVRPPDHVRGRRHGQRHHHRARRLTARRPPRPQATYRYPVRRGRLG